MYAVLTQALMLSALATLCSSAYGALYHLVQRYYEGELQATQEVVRKTLRKEDRPCVEQIVDCLHSHGLKVAFFGSVGRRIVELPQHIAYPEQHTQSEPYHDIDLGAVGTKKQVSRALENFPKITPDGLEYRITKRWNGYPFLKNRRFKIKAGKTEIDIVFKWSCLARLFS